MYTTGADIYLVIAVACCVAVYFIYLFSLRYLPKTALFGIEYPRWLVKTIGRSAAVVFRHPWIWVPALAFFVINCSYELYTTRAFLSGWSYTAPMADYTAFLPSFSDFGMLVCRDFEKVRAHVPVGVGLAWALLYAGCFLLSGRVGALLRSESGLDARSARRWHVVFVTGACAGIIRQSSAVWKWYRLSHLANRIYILSTPFVDLAAVPIIALSVAFYLTIIVRSVRKEPLVRGEVLKSTFHTAWPLALLYSVTPIIYLLLECVSVVLALTHNSQPSVLYAWVGWMVTPIAETTISAFQLVRALVPVIIVSDQCGLLRAFGRLGLFLWRYVWRYAAFVLCGALLFSLATTLDSTGKAVGLKSGILPIYVGFEVLGLAARWATSVVVSVLCFKFYLADAGNDEEVADKTDAPEVQSRTDE
ncbi:MAG: hypothetical protein ABSA67_01900 [Candidatus Brocadiia bacterium]